MGGAFNLTMENPCLERECQTSSYLSDLMDKVVFITHACDMFDIIAMRFSRLLPLALGWLCLAIHPSLSAQTPTLEKSVKPGINDNFLQADLQVGEWVERFEREGREVYDSRLAVLEAIGIKPGEAIADVGAGTGLYTGLFADAVGSEGKVYAVDIVPIFLSRILDRAKETGRNNIVTVLGDGKTSALPEGSVDKVFICDTYHHFEYPQTMLASLHQALRPGGEIILIDFKRIEGTSSEWILSHVRGGQEVFSQEIKQAGFQELGSHAMLKDNYMLRFGKKP